jgi:hypothetical protein
VSDPTLEPLWHKQANRLGYRLGIEGVNKCLFFDRAELEALRSLITDVLEGNYAVTKT